MLRTFRADVAVGGYPNPTYHGTETVSINVPTTASDESAEWLAECRIRQDVAQRMAISRHAIRIRDLTELLE